KRAGFPHSEIRGSKGARPSPRLFAACHVLHRLSVPRHPPNALKRLIRSPSIAHREQSLHRRPQKPRLKTQHFIFVLPAWPMTIRLLVQRPISRSSAQHKPTAANGQSHSYPQCKTTEVTNRKTNLRSRPRPIPVLFPRKRRSRLLLVEPPSRRSPVGSGGAAFSKKSGRLWWSRPGSNRRPPACKAGALPAELRPRDQTTADGRHRTQLIAASPRLRLIHMGPSSVLCSASSDTWWAREDLNFRPHAYQARALTN